MTIPGGTRSLDVYDIAVLAGGLPRLVDTALVSLVESGRVRVEPTGEFRAEATSSRHPVEAAVLDAVGTRGHRSAETIRWQVLRDRRLDQEFQHLTADGLVRRALPSRLVGRTHAHTTAAGRRALREFAELPPVGGSAVDVALRGRSAMPDQRLCAEIFAPRVTPPLPRTPRRSGAVDPSELGRRARGAGGFAAGAGGIAMLHGGGGFGADGGGLDGGGGGGDGGGG